MALLSTDFLKIGETLNQYLAPLNYKVSGKTPSGKPGKVIKSMREYRIQLIDKTRDTSEQAIKALPDVLEKIVKSSITFNAISPNSSKFPSYTFVYNTQKIDVVIARGANRGENFESQVVNDLATFFKTQKKSSDYVRLIDLLNKANKDFADVEIVSAKQRIGSTKKTGVPLANLGEVMGDIVLTDQSGKKWYISLKNVNGNTFSAYPGASTLFNVNRELQPNSEAAEFLSCFGVDLNKVQRGFDLRTHKKFIEGRPMIPVKPSNPLKIKHIMERAWGMNYFYVKKTPQDWKVFWIDSIKLNSLTSNLIVKDIKYPSTTSKQISILLGNSVQNYIIEMRNSSGGEFPNDIKIAVRDN